MRGNGSIFLPCGGVTLADSRRGSAQPPSTRRCSANGPGIPDGRIASGAGSLRSQNTVTRSALETASSRMCARVCMCLCVCAHAYRQTSFSRLTWQQEDKQHRKQKAWDVGLQLRAEGLPFLHRPPSSGRRASFFPWGYRKEQQPWNSPEASGLSRGPPQLPKWWGGRAPLCGLTCRSIRWFQA